jgi:hypothetical protein
VFSSNDLTDVQEVALAEQIVAELVEYAKKNPNAGPVEIEDQYRKGPMKNIKQARSLRDLYSKMALGAPVPYNGPADLAPNVPVPANYEAIAERLRAKLQQAAANVNEGN